MTTPTAITVAALLLTACRMLFEAFLILATARRFGKKSGLDIGAAIVIAAGAVCCFSLAYLYAH